MFRTSWTLHYLYSYRNASMGLSLAALLAGYNPKKQTYPGGKDECRDNGVC